MKGPFTQSDVVRALKAASKACLSFRRFEARTYGKIVDVHGDDSSLFRHGESKIEALKLIGRGE